MSDNIKIDWVDINQLKPAEYNPRKSSQEEDDRLKDSMTKFGFIDPVIVNSAENRKGVIIGGHFRVRVAKAMGITLAPVVYVNIPDIEKEKELNIRLNKNTGSFDLGLLKNFSEDMLKLVGFDSKEMDKIFAVKEDEADNDVPDVKTTDIKLGDMFKLGKHRVLCGDSTCRDDVARLMGSDKVAMIHTDPPYNVDYGSSKKTRHKIRQIENDSMSTDEWSIFCHKLFDIFKEFNTGDIYMWGASSPEGMRMRLWLIELGCHWSATIIWKKQRLCLTPANYQRMYEPCFYGWFDKSSFNDDRKQTEVWEIDRPSNSKLHPTMKPIELCERAIINSSAREDIIMDLFLGSGSTLIAAEKTNRRCYGCEISPEYVEVICARWEKFTGGKREKI